MQTVTSNNKNIFLFLIIIMLFTAVGMIAANTAVIISNDIYHGVTVGDIHLGGLSVEQAEQKLTQVFSERTAKPPIQVVYRDKSWSVSAQEIDLNINAEKLAKEAYEVGRKGNIIQRVKERYLSVNGGHFLPLTVSYSQDKMYNILSNIAKTIDRPAANATLQVNSKSNISIKPEIIGHKVDLAKTLAEATANFTTKLTYTLNVTVNELTPLIVANDLNHIDGVISSYTTQFDPSDENRSQNVKLAAKNINGVLVRHGETFSFNDTVGLRLEKYGYKEAPVYLNGVLVPDWGGGVCQVSSTLYNAVLLADLSIEERTSHFRPPGYVPMGQDATVADNQLDFKFKNTLKQNIYVTAEVYGNQLVVNLYGQRFDNPPDITIVATDKKIIEPSTIIKQDPSLELGKEVVEIEGQKGFHITTYRIKKANGKIVSQELLAVDEFNPVDKVVRVGSKAPRKQKK